MVDLVSFFAQLDQLPLVSRTDLRQGCIARTQIIASLLHAQGFTVGRSWVLPLYESESFYTPLYDDKGVPVRCTDPDSGRLQLVKWRYHCATWLPDIPGQPVVDFPLCAGPVSLERWQRLFTAAQEKAAPRSTAPTELRFATHAFSDIPQRQVLRYHPRSEKHNRLLTPHQLAKLATFPPIPVLDPFFIHVRHSGDEL